MNQLEIRSKLIAIRNNSNLSEDEKRKQSQALLSSADVRCVVIPNRSKTCEHYEKDCSQFFFECCGTYDPCVRCHRYREICDAKIPLISKITCSKCDFEQSPSPCCVSCGVRFSRSYCDICQIWSAKDLCHCFDCGFCRVGKKGEIWHCDICSLCYSIESKDTHVCLPIKIKDEVCNICLESLYTSQQPFTILRCNHAAHQHCMNHMIRQSQFRCPVCKKSVCDMSLYWNIYRQEIASQPLPLNWFGVKESDTVLSPFGLYQIQAVTGDMCKGILIDWQLTNNQSVHAYLRQSDLQKVVYVYCNDCELYSWTLYHFVGFECKHCNSFNTQI